MEGVALPPLPGAENLRIAGFMRPASEAPDVRVIAVMVQPTAMDGPPRMKRLFQGVENKAGMGCPAHPPADDAGIGVDDKGDIDEASPSGHVGKVRDP